MNSRAWERAERILEKSELPISAALPGTGQQKWKSIYQKLADIYAEEYSKESVQTHIHKPSHLLDKLVTRDRLNFLVVNLYPGNEGYSVMLKGRNGSETETVKLPYEESELLQYIDNEELPPILVDLLERSPTNLFYSGSVIVELRDYRRSSSTSVYECRHVLLKPTTQTLLCDINHMTSDSTKWSPEDRLALESNLLLATQEPLCLDPSITVSLVSNYLHNSKHMFGTIPVKKAVKKFTQVSLNRKRKLEQLPSPPGLELYDFVMSRKEKGKTSVPASLKVGKTVDLWKDTPVELEPPSSVDVGSLARPITAPAMPASEISLDVVEDYTLTAEQSNGKGYFSRLVIYQRWPDEIYFGELYVDRDFIEGLQRGASCRFELGSKNRVDGYIRQLIEIVTKESQKSIKLTHSAPGQPTSIRKIPGGKEVASSTLNLGITSLDAIMGSESSAVSLKSIGTKSLLTSSRPEASSAQVPGLDITSGVAIQHAMKPHISHVTVDNISQEKPGSSTSGKSLSTMRIYTPPMAIPSLAHSPALQARVRKPSGQESGVVGNVQLGTTGLMSESSSSTALPQVPVVGITVSQNIAMPISLAMMPQAQTGLMTSHAGVFVSPIQGIVTNASSAQISTTSSSAGTVPLPLALPGTLGSPRVTQLINSQWKGATAGIGVAPTPVNILQMAGPRGSSTGTTARATLASKICTSAQQQGRASPASSPTSGCPSPTGISLMTLVPMSSTQTQSLQFTLQKQRQPEQVHPQSTLLTQPGSTKGKGRKRTAQISPK